MPRFALEMKIHRNTKLGLYAIQRIGVETDDLVDIRQMTNENSVMLVVFNSSGETTIPHIGERHFV